MGGADTPWGWDDDGGMGDDIDDSVESDPDPGGGDDDLNISIPSSLSDLATDGQWRYLQYLFGGALGALATTLSTVNNPVEVAGNLVAFGQNPEEFIFVRIWTRIVGYVLDVATLLIDSVLKLFIMPGDAIGIAEVPLYVTGAIIDAFGGSSDAVFGLIEEFNTSIASIAASGGPVAPLIVQAMWVAEAIAVLFLAERIIKALLSGATDLDPTGITTAIYKFLGGDP